MNKYKTEFYDLPENQAILVTGVKYEIVRKGALRDFVQFGADMSKVHPIDSKAEAIYTETVINMPVMLFGKRESGRNKRMYVSYSPEIEELLDRPYNLMHKDLEEANKLIKKQYLRLSAVDGATFWARLKYLFGADIKVNNG